jgi:hypothetical protein
MCANQVDDILARMDGERMKQLLFSHDAVLFYKSCQIALLLILRSEYSYYQNAA